MQMLGEGCEGLSLAAVGGASPLTLEVPAAERALCPGEVVHVWVAGDLWGGDAGAYYQVDAAQAFRLSGTLLVGAT